MKYLSLSKNAIDLVLTSEKMVKSHKFNFEKYNKFDVSSIFMAEAVINLFFDSTMLLGVKKCIEYQISNITYRQPTLLGFDTTNKLFTSLYNRKFGDDQEKAISILADSLILTVILYRTQLNEKSSGLSEVIINHIRQGFIFTCIWGANFSKDIDPKNNEYIQVIDFEHAISFIPGYTDA